MCGSCIKRTLDNFWKFYHWEFQGEKESSIEFLGRFGGGSYENAGRKYTPFYTTKK